MKKLAIAGAVLAALSLSGCASESTPWYEVSGVPFEQEGTTCVSVDTKSYDGKGFFDLTPQVTDTKVYCVATVKLDQKKE